MRNTEIHALLFSAIQLTFPPDISLCIFLKMSSIQKEHDARQDTTPKVLTKNIMVYFSSRPESSISGVSCLGSHSLYIVEVLTLAQISRN